MQGQPAPGISNTQGWLPDQISERLEIVKRQLCWTKTGWDARQWWLEFEKTNATKPALMLRLAEELLVRQATIAEFHDVFRIAETTNIQASLHFLDYWRLKRLEEGRNRGEKGARADETVCGCGDDDLWGD